MNFYAMDLQEIKRYYMDNGLSHDAIGRLIELCDNLLDDNIQMQTDLEDVKYAFNEFKTALKGII